MGPRTTAASSFASMVTSDSEPDFDDIGTINISNREAGNKTRFEKTHRDKSKLRPDKVVKSTQKLGRSVKGLGKSQKLPAAKQKLAERNLNDLNHTTSTTKERQRESASLSYGGSVGHEKKANIEYSQQLRDSEQTKENDFDPKHTAPKARDFESDECDDCPNSTNVSPQHRELLQRVMPEAGILPQLSHLPNGQPEEIESDTTLEGMIKKYNNLEARHKHLRDVGVKAAEHNFEQLKRLSEASAAVSEKLITELKQKISAQSALLEKMQKDEKQAEQAEARAKQLEERAFELTESLAKATSEIKTLNAKISASRATQISVNMPGTGIKTGPGLNKNGAAETMLAAQAREDLYGDLTGLIVRSIDRKNEEDVFDCIQTGRNGTLHFKLALEKGDGSDVYNDLQLTYSPQLDASRDGDLIRLLPNYLVDEITFTRSQAPNFYSKLNKSLTERVPKDLMKG